MKKSTYSLYDRLIKIHDKEYREFQIKLVPNIRPETIIGVRTPQMRQLAKEMWKSADLRAFLDSVPHKYYEENLIPFLKNGLLLTMYILSDLG